jgi:hypothetical protein
MLSVHSLVRLVTFLQLAASASAGIVRDLTALDKSYDYIIAGGGLSGLVVANRLTENQNSETFLRTKPSLLSYQKPGLLFRRQTLRTWLMR